MFKNPRGGGYGMGKPCATVPLSEPRFASHFQPGLGGEGREGLETAVEGGCVDACGRGGEGEEVGGV